MIIELRRLFLKDIFLQFTKNTVYQLMLPTGFYLYIIYRPCFHQGKNDLFVDMFDGYFSVFILLDLSMTSDSVDFLRSCDMTLS